MIIKLIIVILFYLNCGCFLNANISRIDEVQTGFEDKTVDLPELTIFNSTTITEGDESIFTAHLSKVSSLPITFTVIVGGVSAGVKDINLAPIQITIPPNTLDYQFSIQSYSDYIKENDETFSIEIHDVQGAKKVSDSFNTQVVIKDKLADFSWLGSVLSNQVLTWKTSITALGLGDFFSVSNDVESLSGLSAMALDAQNNILYVAKYTHLLKINYLTGEIMGWIGGVDSSPTGGGSVCTSVSHGQATPTWCRGGSVLSGDQDGFFSTIFAMSVDSATDSLIVAEYFGLGKTRISKIKASTGQFIGRIGYLSASTGTCPTTGSSNGWCTGGTFNGSMVNGGPSLIKSLGIQSGKLYLAETGGYRIDRVDLATGIYEASMGYVTATGGTCTATGFSPWCTGGSFGGNPVANVDGALGGIDALAVSSTYIVATDTSKKSLNLYNRISGNYIGSTGVRSTYSSGTCTIGGDGWCSGVSTFTFTANGISTTDGLAIDEFNNKIYVADDTFDSIQSFNLDTGTRAGAIGYIHPNGFGTCPAGAGIKYPFCTGYTSVSESSLDGGFRDPNDIVIDSSARLVVLDVGNNRIAKHEVNGTPISWLSSASQFSNEWVYDGLPAQPSVETDRSFSSNSFQIQVSTALDSFWLASSYSIKRFNLSSGFFTGWLGWILAQPTGGDVNCSSSGINVLTPGWCTGGTATYGGSGSFSNVMDIKIDEVDKYLYALNYSNYTLAKYDLITGEYIGSIGKVSVIGGTCTSTGITATWCKGGNFTSANANELGGMNSSYKFIIHKASNKIYIADRNNFRVSRFSLISGAYEASIGYVSTAGGSCVGSSFNGWCSGGTFANGGPTVGGIAAPSAIDSDDTYLYVFDVAKISRYLLSTGQYQGSIGYVSVAGGTCSVVGDTNQWCSGGTFSNSASTDRGFEASNYTPVLKVSGNYLYFTGLSKIQRMHLSTGLSAGWKGKIATSPISGDAGCAGASSKTYTPGWCFGGSSDTSGFKANGLDIGSDGYMYVFDALLNRVLRFKK